MDPTHFQGETQQTLGKSDDSYHTAKFPSRDITSNQNLDSPGDVLETRFASQSKRMKLFIRLEALIRVGSDASSASTQNLNDLEEIEKLEIVQRFGLKIFLASLAELFKIYLYSSMGAKALKYVAEKTGITQHVHGLMGNIRSSFELANIKKRQQRAIIMDTEESWIQLNKQNGILVYGFSKDKREADLLVILPFLVFLSQQKTIKPICSLHNKYVEMTMSVSNAFRVMVDESQLPIPILEENTDSLKSLGGPGSIEEAEEDETTPDDTDRSIFEEYSRLKDLNQIKGMKESLQTYNN